MDDAPLPFFSSDEFFAAVANALYPGRSHAGRYVTVEGRTFRVLQIGGREVVGNVWRFPLRYEPLQPPPGEPLRAVPFLPHVCLEVVPADIARGSPASGPVPSPYVDWTDFESWPQYLERVVAHRPGGRAGSLDRDRRYLARDVGPVSFSFDDEPAALAQAFAWKSAQVRRAGYRDRFSDPGTASLYDQLRRRGLLNVSTLRAGDRIAAVWAGTAWHGQYLARLTAYDQRLSRYSPGAILLHRLLEHRLTSGDREFDFLLGREPYKWNYATHARLVGPIGREPLAARAGRLARQTVGDQLARFPRLLDAARRTERRLRSWP